MGGGFMLIFLKPYGKATDRAHDRGKIGNEFRLVFLDIVDNGRAGLSDKFFTGVFCHVFVIYVRADIRAEAHIIDTAVSVGSEQGKQSFPSTVGEAGADRGCDDENHFFFAFKILCKLIDMVMIASCIMTADFNAFTAVDAGIGSMVVTNSSVVFSLSLVTLAWTGQTRTQALHPTQ